MHTLYLIGLLACTSEAPKAPSASTPDLADTAPTVVDSQVTDSGWPAVDDWTTPVSLVVDGQLFSDQSTITRTTAPARQDQALSLQAVLSNHSGQSLTFDTNPESWLSGEGWQIVGTLPASLENEETVQFQFTFNPVQATTAADWQAQFTVPDQPLQITLNAQVPAPLRTVVIGDGGWWATSDDDGQSWTTAPTPSEITSHAHTITYGEGRFFRGDGNSFEWSAIGTYQWSEDGQTWQNTTASADFWPSDCSWGLDLFVCLRGGVLSWSDTGGALIHEATDWSDLMNSIVFVEDHFIGVGRGSRRLWSDDGQIWSTNSNLGEADEYRNVVAGNNTLIAVGGSNRFLISTSLDGGQSWTDQIWGASQYAGMLSVAYNNDIFLAQAQSNYDAHMWRSTDGLNWEAVPNLDQWEAYYLLGSSNGAFIGIYNNALYRSLNGEDWTLVLTPPTGVSLRDMAVETIP